MTRAALTDLAAELGLPLENLVSPDLVRRIDWTPPAGGDEAAVAAALRAGGAREWQVELVAPVLTDGLRATAADLAAAQAAAAEDRGRCSRRGRRHRRLS